MTDKLEYKGYWWLPSNPNKTVAGILTYMPNERITLELIGTFDSENVSTIALLDSKLNDIIHGITSDSGKITLYNCYPSGSANWSCSFPITRYSCQFIIIGKHLDSFKQKCFYKALIIIPELSNWCLPTALTTIIQPENNAKIVNTSVSFNTERKVINETKIDDNTELSIVDGVIYHGDYLSPKIEQYTCLEIFKHTDTMIEDFYYNVYMFEQFLSLATLQTIKCSKIILFDKTLYQELEDGTRIDDSIQIIYVQRELNQLTKAKRHDLLFDYESISQQYTNIIKKWYTEKEDIGPIRAHLIDSISNKMVFTNGDFLIVIQAIEGFCTRFRKESKLSKMLEAIISEFSDIDILKNDNIVINQAVDSRHYYSHFMHKSKKQNILDGLALYDLTFKLRKLLICCILNFIGFDNSQINQILNKSNSIYLIK